MAMLVELENAYLWYIFSYPGFSFTISMSSIFSHQTEKVNKKSITEWESWKKEIEWSCV